MYEINLHSQQQLASCQALANL